MSLIIDRPFRKTETHQCVRPLELSCCAQRSFTHGFFPLRGAPRYHGRRVLFLLYRHRAPANSSAGGKTAAPLSCQAGAAVGAESAIYPGGRFIVSLRSETE